MFTLIIMLTQLVVSQDYTIYFGDLHSHTGYSDGQGTPAIAYGHARTYGDADFLAVTDHSWFGKAEWDSAAQAAHRFTTESFVAIRGFELTTSWGHINVYNTDWFTSYTDIHSLYTMLVADTVSFAQWNHPTEYSDEFFGFSFYTPEIDNRIHLIEIENHKRDMRFESSYIRALDKGWHVGPAANSDMHCNGWITGYELRTALLATGLSRGELFSAIRNHRVYATEDRNLQIRYHVNGAVMGSVVINPGRCTIDLTVQDPDTLESGDRIRLVEVISRNGSIVASKLFNAHYITWNTTIDNSDSSDTYYFLRVTNADGKTAVTAPVWVEYRKEKQPERKVREGTVTLYDLSGRVVQKVAKRKHVSSRLPSGIYILTDDSDGRLKPRRFPVLSSF